MGTRLRAGRAVFVVALLVGASLRIWVADSGQRVVPLDGTEFVPAEPERHRTPELTVPEARDGGPAQTPESRDPPPFRHRIRAVSDRTSTPVAGAEVRLVETRPTTASSALHSISRLLGEGTTDAAGSIELTLANLTAPPVVGVVQVEHDEFAPASVPPATEGETVVRLADGLPIGGRVVDRATGRGVVGVTVSIVSRELPTDFVGAGVSTDGRLVAVTTPVDDHGRFSKVVPAGTYSIRAGGGDWGDVRPRPGVFESRSGLVFADAGDTDVRIEVERYLFVRFELRDSSSGLRITQSPKDIFVLDRREDVGTSGAGGLLAGADLFANGRWSKLGPSRNREPGRYLGVVPARSGDFEVTATRAIRLALDVPRYRPSSVRLRLLTLEEIRAGEMDTIRLQRTWDSRSSSLVVRIEPTPSTEKRLSPRLATSASDDEGWVVHQPLRLTDSAWRVDDLPPGPFRVRAVDEFGLGDEQAVELAPGAETTVSIRMPEPTGISVDVRSPSDVPVLTPEIWVKPEVGPAGRIAGAADGWDVVERLDSGYPPVYATGAGRFQITVNAPGGWGWYSADVEVRTGQIVRISGRLLPPLK